MSGSSPVAEAVEAFLTAPTVAAKRQIIEEHRDLLLTEATHAVFNDLLAQNRDDPQTVEDLTAHRTLLAQCRTAGIEVAFGGLLRPELDSDAVLEAVLALVNARTEAAFLEVLGLHRDVLTSEGADSVLASLLAQNDGQPDAVEHLLAVRSILAELLSESAVSAPLTEAILAFVNARTWVEARTVVEVKRDLLFEESADAVFADLLRKYEEDEAAIRNLNEHRQLLNRCRTEGIDAAFANLPIEAGNPGAIEEAVLAFVNAHDWHAVQQQVEAHQNVLMTDEADALLAILLNQWQDNEDSVKHLNARRALLARCRNDGIDVAFAELKYENRWESLTDEFSRLSEKQDLVAIAALCRNALEFIDREVEPEHWAILQVELGNSLFLDPRANSAAQAIEHYERALEIFTPEDFPDEWAGTQHGLASAYMQSSSGQRGENLMRVSPSCQMRWRSSHARSLLVNGRDYNMPWAMRTWKAQRAGQRITPIRQSSTTSWR